MQPLLSDVRIRAAIAFGFEAPAETGKDAGTVAREWTGPVPDPVGAPAAPASGAVIGTAKRGGHEGH